MKRCSKKQDDCANPPAYFRLPRSGERDPYFQLPKTAYYDLAQAGNIRFARIKKSGQSRGTTLVNYAEMLAYVRSLGQREDA